MKRRISVTLDSELVDWLDSIHEHRSRDRGGTIRQFLRLAKQATETGEIGIDPVVHVAFQPTQRYLVQDAPDATGNIIPFPGVARRQNVAGLRTKCPLFSNRGTGMPSEVTE